MIKTFDNEIINGPQWEILSFWTKWFVTAHCAQIQRHLSCKIDTFFARHAAARQWQRRRRLLLNLWRNFDGGSLASTSLNDLHFDFAIMHAVICQLFVKKFGSFCSQAEPQGNGTNFCLSTAVCENWSLPTAPWWSIYRCNWTFKTWIQISCPNWFWLFLKN